MHLTAIEVVSLGSTPAVSTQGRVKTCTDSIPKECAKVKNWQRVQNYKVFYPQWMIFEFGITYKALIVSVWQGVKLVLGLTAAFFCPGLYPAAENAPNTPTFLLLLVLRLDCPGCQEIICNVFANLVMTSVFAKVVGDANSYNNVKFRHLQLKYIKTIYKDP